MVIRWLKQLDSILRGETTRPGDLTKQGIRISLPGLSLVILVLAMIYGACMGTYALFRLVDDPSLLGLHHRVMQLIASTVKVPALFALTLVVTFPSLYVFNALVGSRLGLMSLLKLLIAALAVNLAVLSSLGPIVAFFSISTTGYSFMVLLNVAVFSVAGGLGLYFLLQTLHRMTPGFPWQPRAAGEPRLPDASSESGRSPSPDASSTGAEESPAEGHVGERPAAGSDAPPNSTTGGPTAEDVDEPGALDWFGTNVLSRHVRTVFYCWIVLFGLVGAQMGWVLRPFIGDPDKPFTWFRQRQSNFFEAVWASLVDLLM